MRLTGEALGLFCFICLGRCLTLRSGRNDPMRGQSLKEEEGPNGKKGGGGGGLASVFLLARLSWPHLESMLRVPTNSLHGCSLRKDHSLCAVFFVLLWCHLRRTFVLKVMSESVIYFFLQQLIAFESLEGKDHGPL